MIFPTYGYHSIKMMGPILLVKIYSSKKMCEFSELSTITVDPPESNTTGSGDLTTEESMWHSLYFEILQNKKGVFLVWPLGGFLPALQLSLLEFGFPLLVLDFYLGKVSCWYPKAFELGFEYPGDPV